MSALHLDLHHDRFAASGGLAQGLDPLGRFHVKDTRVVEGGDRRDLGVTSPVDILIRRIGLHVGICVGIRNRVAPFLPLTDRQRQQWFKTQESIDAVVSRQPIRQVLLGEEIARTVLFLASDDSRMITKQSITVDAGLR